MPDVKEVVNGLEMSYKYSNVDENNTLVPQWIVLHALALLKAQEARTCSKCRHYDTNAFTDIGGKCRNSLSCHYCYECDKTFGCNAWEGR